MRNMSFRLTTEQVRNQTKTVTRRLGWASLRVGELLQPVVKGQGLRKGEKVERIGGPIRVKSVTREPLYFIASEKPFGTVREGFPEMTCIEFITMFCDANKCSGDQTITRIEFEYVNVPHA